MPGGDRAWLYMAFDRLIGRLGGSFPVIACRIDLDGLAVDYQLRRSHRRTLALSVDERGVRVSAPVGVRDGDIVRFLRQHRDWLAQRLDARAATLRATRLCPHDGALIPVLGNPCRLRLVAGLRQPQWSTASDGLTELSLPASGDAGKRLVAALKARAMQLYVGRVEEYCLRLGVSMPRVSLTAARTRWGSCSLRTGIRLHWRLIHLAPELIDYVVAHEVAHLREMNHSPRFWSLVQSVCPDWQRLRAGLRIQGRDLPVIDGSGDTPALLEE